MFTIPVGNFNKTTTTKRPTSSAQTLTGDGFVTNANNAFDQNLTTYASIGNVSSGTAEVVYSLWAADILTTGVTVKLLIEATGQYIGTAYETGTLMQISIDGGTTYPYSFNFLGEFVEASQTGPGRYVNLINAPIGIIISSLAVPVSAPNIKVKISTAMIGTIKLYDVYYEI
ncbi:MAG: hypothetical protein WCO52_06235 [bacterium]